MVQHIHPLELSCDRKSVESNSMEVQPNRPKRDAAVAARERIAEISGVEEEQD